jgi:hypothetical protein
MKIFFSEKLLSAKFRLLKRSHFVNTNQGLFPSLFCLTKSEQNESLFEKVQDDGQA